MARASGVLVVAVLATMVCGCGPKAPVAPAPTATALQPDDAVETLTVTLAVSDAGAALGEPVALDLGLGYPLWLHPVGREEGEPVPFGAVAQTSTAGRTIEPGEQATFTFGVDAASGLDVLQATRHLLADTRVGDIRRIGLASERGTDWILGDLEIRINGERLHADRAAPRAPDAAQQALTARIAAIDLALADLGARYEALEAPRGADREQARALESAALPLLDERRTKAAQLLVDPRSAGATREADELRLAALRETAAGEGPRREEDVELHRLQARLAGRHPWHVADAFRPPWIPASDAVTASVTVETGAHAGADTVNPVHVRVGGHKYALNGPHESLSAAAGAQTFDLDLVAGPLAPADLGRWALGMLAAADAQGAVPDRWHAQRLLVTVDEKVVYDSEDDARDRRSLDAVRLIPPAQRVADGSVATNAPSVREVFLWEAGGGAGLDSAGTGAAPLPAPSDPTYPRPEAGLAPDAEGAGTSAPNTAFPAFPGERTAVAGGGWGGWRPGGSWAAYGTGPSPGGAWGPWVQGGIAVGPGGGSAWGGLGSGGGGGGQGPGWGSWGGTPGGSPGGSTTTGKPFQMQEVWISSGWKLNEPFTVEWKVSGDTSGIRHFLVSLRVVRPDQAQGVLGDAAKQPVKVAVGQRSCTVLVDPKFQPKQPYHYLAPVVTAVTSKSGTKGLPSHVRIGPARAVFPASANDKIQPVPTDVTWQGGGAKPLSVGTAGKPLKHRTACFVAGAETPDAVQIGLAKPASHVAVRPQHGDRVTVRYEIPSFTGRQQLVGHVGFMGATIAADKAEVEVACTLVGKGKTYAYPVRKDNTSTSGSLAVVEQLLDAADLGVAMEKAQVRVTFAKGGALDPKCVPGVYGLRLYPVKGTASPTQVVNADLVVDPTATWLVPGDLRDGIQGGPARQLCLAVRNNGPDAIPAALLREIKVVVKYYVGQRGDAFSTKYGQTVAFGPARVTDLRELSSGGAWKGSLEKGGVLRLVPTPPAGHADLDVDGNLLATKSLDVAKSNAFKLFRVWADIQASGAPALKESDPNNVWTYTWRPPLILGKGPLDYEVLLFEQEAYQGASERYEFDPDTQRQRLVWHLAQMPGKRDMYQKVRSCQIGREIGLRAAQENHFYTCNDWGNWPLEVTGGTKGAYRDRNVPAIGSLILFPRSAESPIGAMFHCRIRHWTFKGTIDNHFLWRDVFIPLPEKRGDTVVRMPTLIDELDDEIEIVHVWRTRAMQGPYPVAWVKVTLFEDAGLGKQGGERCTLDGPFYDQSKAKVVTHGYHLGGLPWDGLVAGQGALGVDEEASSLLLELVAGAGK